MKDKPMPIKEKYYQFQVVGPSDGDYSSGLITVHVLAKDYEEARLKAKLTNTWEQNSFRAFLRKYNYVKYFTWHPYEDWLTKGELLGCWYAGILAVFERQNRIDSQQYTADLIHKEVRSLLIEKLKQ